MSDEQARRTARREAAKRLHPDRGGDAGEFDRAMRSFDTAAAAGPARTPTTASARDDAAARGDAVHVRRTRRGTWATTLRSTTTLVADVRRRLPRSFPGSRRYGRL